MELVCYFDFTCAYSHRAWLWIEGLRGAGSKLDVDWRPFLLKEVNREGSEPSSLVGPTIDSTAVLALAVAEALRGETGAAGYRSEVFQAMHAGDERPGRDAIIQIATSLGLDVDSFWRDETLWLAAVRASHERAVGSLGVFGTPTLVFGETEAIYLKLAALPAGDGRNLWDCITTVTTDFPEVLELKRPSKT